MRRLAALAVVMAVSIPLTVSAQRASKRVYVSAQDAFGAPVLNLTAADFDVTENGSKREVTRVTPGTAPMRIVLLVDSSTATQPMMTVFRQALNTFVDALPPQHEISFITSGGQIRVRTQPSTDRAQLKSSIGLLASEGGANAFLETLIEADQRYLKTAPAQWPVFVILSTDISDSRREPDIGRYNRFMNDFLSRGGSAHAVIVAGKGFGPVTDLTINLVQNTGGMYTAIVADSGLPERLKNIAERLSADHQQMRNRYEVEFSGDARALKAIVNVAMTRPDVQVEMSPRRPF
jgi:hypothetical protein